MKKLAVGIVNYAHPSAGGLAVLRAVRRSRRQALASSGEAGFRPDLGPSRFSRCPAPRERMEHLFWETQRWRFDSGGAQSAKLPTASVTLMVVFSQNQI